MGMHPIDYTPEPEPDLPPSKPDLPFPEDDPAPDTFPDPSPDPTRVPPQDPEQLPPGEITPPVRGLWPDLTVLPAA